MNWVVTGTALHTAIQRIVEVPIRTEPQLIRLEPQLIHDQVRYSIPRHTSQAVWTLPNGLVTTTPPSPDAVSMGTTVPMRMGIDPGIDSWTTAYLPESYAEERPRDRTFESQIMGEWLLGGDLMHGSAHEPTEPRRVGRRSGMSMAASRAMFEEMIDRLPDLHTMIIDSIVREDNQGIVPPIRGRTRFVTTLDDAQAITGRTPRPPEMGPNPGRTDEPRLFQRGFAKVEPFDDALRPSRRAILAAGGMDLEPTS